jgi:hypothetical protein
MMTMMKAVKRNALLALIALGGSVTPALATECVQIPSTSPLLSGGDVIFSGTITEHLRSGARFLVTEAFKGAKTKYVDVIEMNEHFENMASNIWSLPNFFTMATGNSYGPLCAMAIAY